MRISTVRSLSVAVALAAVVWPASAPRADAVADFYKNRTLTLYVGVSPGGIYSTFALMLARYIGQYVPGHPTVVVQHMRGAGGTKAINYVVNVAPKDGSVFLTPNAGVDKRVVLKIGHPKYNPAKFRWLGGWGEAVNTLTLRSDAPVKTLQEAMKTQVILGAIGKSSNTYMIPSLMNNVLGTKFKIVTGYRGGSPIRAAIQKGELHGWAGQWLGWKLRLPGWVRDKKIVNLVQMASKRAPDLPDVPLLSDFARNDEEREMFDFVQTGISDRAFVAGPGLPGDRVAALGKAYHQVLRNKKFLAEAGKHSYVIDPVPGKVIQDFVEKIMSMPPAKVDKIRRAMGLMK